MPLPRNSRLELFGELKNLFNRKNVRAVNAVVSTDELGHPVTAIPSDFPLTNTCEQRQFQLGVRYHF